MQSGTTGINAVRIYNPVKQGYDHDPTGTFVRHWVPELAKVKTAYIQEPWKMSKEDQQAARCIIGSNYPERIIDHERASREARRRIYAIRKGVSFREKTSRIQEKHGSRKGTQRKYSGRRKHTGHSSAQGTLDL